MSEIIQGMEDQDPTYQTFKMQDFARQPEWLLTQIDYLEQMFDLEVENQRDKPIVICLREKAEHFSERKQNGDGIFR